MSRSHGPHSLKLPHHQVEWGDPLPHLGQGTHHFRVKTACLFLSSPGGCAPVFIYFLVHFIPSGSLHLQHFARVQAGAAT